MLLLFLLIALEHKLRLFFISLAILFIAAAQPFMMVVADNSRCLGARGGGVKGGLAIAVEAVREEEEDLDALEWKDLGVLGGGDLRMHLVLLLMQMVLLALSNFINY